MQAGGDSICLCLTGALLWPYRRPPWTACVHFHDSNQGGSAQHDFSLAWPKQPDISVKMDTARLETSLKEAGVLKKLSLAGIAKQSQLKYNWLRFVWPQPTIVDSELTIGLCTQPANSQLIPQSRSETPGVSPLSLAERVRCLNFLTKTPASETVKELPGYLVQNSPSGSFLSSGGAVCRGE